MRATLANTKATCKGVAVAVGEDGDEEVIMTKGALARRRLVLANIAYLKDDFSTRKVKSDVETCTHGKRCRISALQSSPGAGRVGEGRHCGHHVATETLEYVYRR